MGRLLQLLLRNGGFVTLIFVELLCFALMTHYGTNQSAVWVNTTEIFGAHLLEKRQNLTDYLSLHERADSLARVVDSLQARLANTRVMQVARKDTMLQVTFDTLTRNDSVRLKNVRPWYVCIAGKVIGNTIANANNWIILNRGRSDKVEPHMAVISPNGVVGIVRHVSEHYSIAMSVLHSQMRITASLPKQGTFGSLVWEGGDPEYMTLKDISKHFQDKINVGDPVTTSAYSLIFPRDIPVGQVASLPQPDPENPHFLIVKIKLSQDITNVNDVSIVSYLFATEIDSLKTKVKQ